VVFRVYVEKQSGFDVQAQQLSHELRTVLGLKGLKSLRLINRYDVEGISSSLFEQSVPTVFSEPQTDMVSDKLPKSESAHIFAVEYLPGQFDQRAESASECIQLMSQGERPTVGTATVYLIDGQLSDDDLEAIKRYVINPVEAREASLDVKQTLNMQMATPTAVEVVKGFVSLDESSLAQFIEERGLAMDLADIIFCQKYFQEEQRDPTITEIKVIDTYWSDHCRHTTFGTQLQNIQIDDAVVQKAFDRYLSLRHELGRDEKNPVHDGYGNHRR
jgi:phosphoribosylformylglycinamidine synthase